MRLNFFLIEWITDYLNTPKIEQTPQFGTIKFTMEQSDCKLCVDCMRKYIKFIKGGDVK